MHPVKSGAMALLVALGLSVGSAYAFGPMMLLMLPMMTGGQHVQGNSHGSGEEKVAHTPPASHAEQNHPATLDEPPIPSTVRSESSQAGSEAESEPVPREITR
jgi:hypothetical protein